MLKIFCPRSLGASRFSNFLIQFRYKSFSAAISEGLDKLVAEKETQKAEKAESYQLVREMKRKKQNLKRRQWVEDDNDPAVIAKRAAFNPEDRVKRKKHAICLGYCGANYFGMQRNPQMPTIEEELFKAMLKNKWITQEDFEQPQECQFQRAARTDKGVSAARQVCSLKLANGLDPNELNKDLPEQIRVFVVRRVTKGFNSKESCNARTYTYTMPTISLAKFDDKEGPPDFESYRIDAESLKQFADVLKCYEGTKNFHNFTSKKLFNDPSAKRYIISFTHSEPFVSPQGVEFITASVKGQSFMLHQIRKMIGLAIAIVRGNTTLATMDLVFSEKRIDLATAPGLGLVLDTVHYDIYNKHYGADGVHQSLTWEENEDEIKTFIEKYITSQIYEIEYKEKPMLNWLETLNMHSFTERADETRQDDDNNSGKNNKQDDEEE